MQIVGSDGRKARKNKINDLKHIVINMIAMIKTVENKASMITGDLLVEDTVKMLLILMFRVQISTMIIALALKAVREASMVVIGSVDAVEDGDGDVMLTAMLMYMRISKKYVENVRSIVEGNSAADRIIACIAQDHAKK